MKALFVDDDPMILDIYEEEIGYEIPELKIITAADGIEALEAYELEKPELVFTDGKMPNMNGLELAYKLSEMPTPPKIYMITGHFGEVSKDPNFTDKILKVFDKPVDFDEFVAFVKDLIA